MKKSPLEVKLETQEMLRLNMLEQVTDISERRKLLEEISMLNEMRDGLEGNRLDKVGRWKESLIRWGLPCFTTLALALIGFQSEQLNGNPTGFTLKWLFNRAPRG